MKKNSFSSVGGMLDGVLARHGIAKQVLATSLVREASLELGRLLPPEMMDDVKVLSFKQGQLTVACKNATAVYDAEGLSGPLARKLEERFPTLSITVQAKLRPDAFIEH